MDRRQFDALARLVATRTSRRGAIAALLGAAFLPLAPEAVRAQNDKQRPRRAGKCFPGDSCIPGTARINTRCDFSGSALFRGLAAQASNLSQANFTLADLSGANLRAANLRGACLVGADLMSAIVDESTRFTGAIFCQTTMPDGSVNNSGCQLGTACCPTSLSPGGGGVVGCQTTQECQPGQACCNRRCVDTRSDPRNCGTCGNVCGPQQICTNGQCLSCTVCAAGCVFNRIQPAIESAAALSTITICPGTYRERLRIGKNLTLVGLGFGPAETIIDGTLSHIGRTAVLTVDRLARVTVRNLTIANGQNSGAGPGAGVTNAGDLTLDAVDVRDNQGFGANGGGIGNSGLGARLTLANCIVDGNSGRDGGGISNEQGLVTLRRTRVSNNGAFTGGGIAVKGGAMTIDENSAIEANVAAFGGGIHNDGGTVTVSASIVSTNTAQGESGVAGLGGGIDNVKGTVIITNESSVERNTAIGGPGSGGGVFNAGRVVLELGGAVGLNTPDNCVNEFGGTGCPA
jgi:hypothetical protein